MKIAFILPAIGKKKNQKYLRSWLMEPLTIAVLNRLTPVTFQRVFYDDRLEAVDFDTDAEIIALTVETYTAKRAYEIARRFKAKGKTIIMGGYHATLLPEDVRPHADIVVTGNAEGIWGQVLSDLVRGTSRAEYHGELRLDYGLPDRTIYQDKLKQYLPVSLVEIGRGCHHHCEFCSIHAYYQGCYAHRQIEDILTEIRQCPHKLFFFVDDSIFSDKVFARALFTELAKLRIIWVTQVTLDIARDEELLHLMKKSGCEMILIGFESIDAQNLAQMHKEWSIKLGERDELVERIHRCGISIYASFVFGFDQDNEQSFSANLAFCQKHRFFVTAFNHLLAFPNTPTYERFQKDGRLLHAAWWLQEGYTFGTVSFQPKKLSTEQLMQMCKKSKMDFFAFPSIFKRGITLLRRTRRPSIILVFWLMNLLFHFEVDQRFGIPLGGNLDEARK